MKHETMVIKIKLYKSAFTANCIVKFNIGQTSETAAMLNELTKAIENGYTIKFCNHWIKAIINDNDPKITIEFLALLALLSKDRNKIKKVIKRFIHTGGHLKQLFIDDGLENIYNLIEFAIDPSIIENNADIIE